MNTKWALLGAAALLCHQAVWQTAEAGDALPTLRCMIAQCAPAEDCMAPFVIDSGEFLARAGSDFLFQLTDDWKISTDHYRLENRRYTGSNYMARTTLNIDVDRTTKTVRLALDYIGSGVTPRSVTASGTCEIINTVPVTF